MLLIVFISKVISISFISFIDNTTNFQRIKSLTTMSKIKSVDAKVVIECEYTTRPGAKKEYQKTVSFRRSKSAKEKVDQYSGGVEISAKYKNPAFEVSGAVKTSWNNTHSFSTSTEEEYLTSNESFKEYYDDVTLLIRSLKFKYVIEDALVENKEEVIVMNLKDNYSVEQLYEEAKKYMKKKYGAENSTVLEIPIVLAKEIFVKWKTFNRGDVLPKTAVYAGNTGNDGAVYVGRVDNTPGKVNLDNGKIWNYWVHGYYSRQSGEILLTNGDCKWVRIKRYDAFPKNAVFSGRDYKNDKVWIGKSVSGEPGKITCENNDAMPSKMWNLWSHGGSRSEFCEVLTIS